MEEDEEDELAPESARSVTDLPIMILNAEAGQPDVRQYAQSLDVNVLSRSLDKSYISPLASLREEREGLLQGARSVGHLGHGGHHRHHTPGVKFRGSKERTKEIKELQGHLLSPISTASELSCEMNGSITAVQNLDGNITGSNWSLKNGVEQTEVSF